MTRFIKPLLFLLLFVLSVTSNAQSLNLKNVDNYLNYIEKNNLGVGSVSIIKDGKELYSKNFGQKTIKDLKFDNNTKYYIGSVTKMMTATLIFKLIENGQLKLDDKLADFYPEIPNSRLITIKNLLEHSSGLGSYVVKNGEVWVTKPIEEKELFNLIVEQGVSFQPNEDVKYSNSAYYLLAKIVEKKYKKPFHKIFNKEIARPLKLKNIASVESNPKNVFLPYVYKNNEWIQLTDEIYFPNVIGVGDMVSTSKELNTFINALFDYKIIKKETLEKMVPFSKKEGWGRGIAIWPFDDFIFYGHGGDTLGSHALLIYNKENNLSISYNTNGERINKEEFMKYIVYSLFDKEFTYPEIQ